MNEAKSPAPIKLNNMKIQFMNPQDVNFNSSIESPLPTQVTGFNIMRSPAPAKLQEFDPSKQPFSPKANDFAQVKSPVSPPKVNNFFDKRNHGAEEVKIQVKAPLNIRQVKGQE